MFGFSAALGYLPWNDPRFNFCVENLAFSGVTTPATCFSQAGLSLRSYFPGLVSIDQSGTGIGKFDSCSDSESFESDRILLINILLALMEALAPCPAVYTPLQLFVPCNRVRYAYSFRITFSDLLAPFGLSIDTLLPHHLVTPAAMLFTSYARPSTLISFPLSRCPILLIKLS